MSLQCDITRCHYNEMEKRLFLQMRKNCNSKKKEEAVTIVFDLSKHDTKYNEDAEKKLLLQRERLLFVFQLF